MNPLPIDHILPELIEAVLAKPAVVLQAPPGSGKTTRVPLALLGADIAALLSERDIMRRNNMEDRERQGGADIGTRIEMLRRWRKEKHPTAGTDPYALRAVEQAAEQLRNLAEREAGRPVRGSSGEPEVSSLLIHAYPDRIAKKREDGSGRYLLSQGRGVRLPRGSGLTASPYLIAVHLDGGEKAEGTIHMAEPVSEEIIRRELGAHIETRRQVEWDKQEGRIVSFLTEGLGVLSLSTKPFPVPDEEALPILCAAIRSGAADLTFGGEDRQFQGRVALLSRAFPGENWPDLSEAALLSSPEGWLAPSLAGIRTGEHLAGLALLPALQGLLSRAQRQRLDEGAPKALTVPSGRSVFLDYTAGELPVLAVKLQELFGLAATPTVAGGRVAVLIHLLSPAGRPVQITRDLKGFWATGYPQVKKELQGRYPKHPWPDNPLTAVPTHREKGQRK